VLLNPEVLCYALEAQPIGLPLVAQQIGVRLPHHDENRAGKIGDDARQRAQSVFNALVRRKEPEGEQHLFARHAELVLVEIWIGKRHIGDAMRDEIDFFRGRLVNVEQDAPALFGHNDKTRRETNQLAHNAQLVRVGIAQDRMQGGHDRHVQLVQQREQVAARHAAEDAELVLHAENIDIRDVQEIGRAQIGRQLPFLYLEAHLRGIVVPPLDVIDRHDQALQGRELRRHRRAQVCREGRNAALSREIVSQERDLADVG